MEKDNGYVETGTEAFAAANGGENREQLAPAQASAVLGKFKDVDALAKAYGCLEAEFTRRSQTLKQLQKEMDNLKAEKENVATGVEKLRKSAAARRAEEEKFDAYISGLEQANVRAEESPQTQTVSAQTQAIEATQEGVERKALSMQEQSAASLQPSREISALSDDELFDSVMQNEGVRLKIVGNYLSSLTKNGAPLLAGGTGALAAPPQRAKSFTEAGSMALQMFHKNGKQA